MVEKPVEKKSKVNPDEGKAGRFKRIVTPRVTKALKSISLIGNCAGAGYNYTPEEAAQIILVLGRELHILETKFREKKTPQSEFTFKP